MIYDVYRSGVIYNERIELSSNFGFSRISFLIKNRQFRSFTIFPWLYQQNYFEKLFKRGIERTLLFCTKWNGILDAEFWLLILSITYAVSLVTIRSVLKSPIEVKVNYENVWFTYMIVVDAIIVVEQHYIKIINTYVVHFLCLVAAFFSSMHDFE